METGQSKGKPAYRKYWIFLYGAILGAVFDIFFYNKTLGISYPLFILIILSIIFLTFWGNVKELRNWSWFFAVPAMLLSLTFFLYSNQLLKTLNYFLIPILIITLASKVAGVNRADWSDIRFVGDIAKRVFVPFRFIHRPFMEVPEAGDKTDCAGDENNNKRKGKGRLATKIIAGFLISIPILAIILWLLTSADIVFKNFFINIPAAKIFKHFLIIASVSIYSICFIWTLKKAFKERQENKLQARQYKRQLKQFLDPVVLLTILILINAVYLVFSFIQFAYLFGGSSYILPSSFTYAEYARRGFAELTAVTIINFTIIQNRIGVY